MTDIFLVRTGTKYSIEYLIKLERMLRDNSTLIDNIYCLTDSPETKVKGIINIPLVGKGFNTWWGKMALFNPAIRPGRAVFFDLDTIICGNIDPLLSWSGEFGICQNFTKLAGNKKWPCNYGSCVMSLAPGFGQHIFESFLADTQGIISRCPKGDQQAIELLHPKASYLQNEMPPGFFVGRRDFKEVKQEGAAVMIFAGHHKPHNTNIKWLKRLWNE